MELQAWHLKWKQQSTAKNINTLPKALAALDKTAFPNLFSSKLEQLYLSLVQLVNSQSVLYTFLRSTMTNE